jgi:radical SAM protein with 4Fe4S-binding SPASM domain
MNKVLCNSNSSPILVSAVDKSGKLVVTDLKYLFQTLFDTNTGLYIRSDILEGENKGKEPVMASFPHLLDIGIMGNCKNAHLCNVGCYQNSPSDAKQNMSADDYCKLMDQISGLTMQVALGGGGSPNEHLELSDMLAYSKERNVSTAYTTSGIGLTDYDVRVAKQNCGAVAVSWYGQPYTLTAIDKFLKAGVRTNIHYVLSKASIKAANLHLLTRDFPVGIGAVIFLMYKPVGKLANKDLVLQHDDPELMMFKAIVNEVLQTADYPFKIGFDSCSTPAIINDIAIDPRTLDYCEAGRFSAYIDNNMVMMPCSFLKYQPEFHVDLRVNSVMAAWNSPQFDAWRKKLVVEGGCKTCPQSASGACIGTCKACNLNICAKAVE